MKCKEWNEYSLFELLSDKGYIRGPFGSSLKRNELHETGIAVYEQQHAIYNTRAFRYFIDEKKYNKMERFSVKKDDIIISCSGTVGKVSIINNNDPKGIISQALLLLRVNNNLIYPLYLKYFFETKKGYNSIIERSSGSVQVNIAKRSIIENIRIKVPLLSIQNGIIKIIKQIDDKIELNNKINDNLQQQAQALFKSWFVDFEPWGGVMPEDWKFGILSDLASITSGKRPINKFDDYESNHSIPIIGASKTMGYTTDSLYNEKIIVIGRVGTHGIVQRVTCNSWPSDNTIVIKSKYYEFVYNILKTINYRNLNRGSTQPLITQTDIKNTTTIIPSIEVINTFENVVGSLMASYQINTEENRRLAELRDTLLPKLMSGELDVSEVEPGEAADA